MAESWLIYATVPRTAATRAVEATYETLGGIVGKDLAEHLEPGEDLEPPVLGFWPDISVSASASVPTTEAERTSLTDPAKTDASFEEAALARLAKCMSTIRVERPQGFDPAFVSAVRTLLGHLGKCVFTNRPGFHLSTSETLLVSLAEYPDLASTLRAVAAGELDEDGELDDDEDEEEDDEPASDSERPEVLRKILEAIAQHPRARRKAGELLAEAPEIVGTFAERLARLGAEPDPAVAKALDVKERDVVGARKALATILRRAENR